MLLIKCCAWIVAISNSLYSFTLICIHTGRIRKMPQATWADIQEEIGQKCFDARGQKSWSGRQREKGSNTAKKRAVKKDFQTPQFVLTNWTVTVTLWVQRVALRWTQRACIQWPMARLPGSTCWMQRAHPSVGGKAPRNHHITLVITNAE